MDLQTFDVEVAKEYGFECAVLFQTIGYWAKHNRNKPDRQRDGKAWMYMSRREWLEEFAYIGEGTLRSSLEKLSNAGLIERGNYSEGMYARTTWYTLTNAGWELWLKQPKGLANSAKGFGENSQTITDTNITTTNSTIPPTPKGEPDGFKEFWDAYPNKVKRPKAMAIWARLKASHADVMAGLRRWKASEQWTKDKGKFIPHPTSWLNAEGWNDAIPGEVAPMPPEKIEALRQRVEEAERQHKENMARLAQQRSDQLLGRGS